jgi:leucyl aminopeptidase
MVGCHGQDLHRAEKSRHPFGALLWSGGDDAMLKSARILGESILLTRRLVDESPHEMYPETFAQEAAEVARELGLETETWDQARLEAERCGSLLAVNRGSIRPPRLVILRYKGAGNAPTLAIVGKGVTFDSGGLSLKPSDSMLTMKCDMAGAATMLGALRAIALLKLPINVIGLAGLVENMTGPAAMKLGDVLTARNGRTIEVHNTDAEGRLVLADVLTVAVDQGASRIVDLATLTGGCVVALGTEVAGLMSNDQPWCDAVAAAARKCGEPVWQLPMYPDYYDDMIKAEVADIKNVGDGRWASPIAAAKFLEQFVSGKPWTHIDIAGPAFRDKPKPWSDAGATGTYVRTLVELARHGIN